MSLILLSDLLADSWTKDWAAVYLIGGAMFSLFGFLFGWIVWRKFRSAADSVEIRNREAIDQFEKAAERARRLKSELSGSVLD